MLINSRIRLFIVSLLAIALLGFFLLDLNNVRVKNEDSSRILNAVEQLEAQREAVQNIQLSKNKSEKDVASFEAQILTDSKIVPVIEMVERAGRSLGLETKILSVEKVQEENGQRKVTLIVETKGSWQGATSYLQAIESLPYPVKINEVHFNKSGSLWSGSINFSLNIFN